MRRREVSDVDADHRLAQAAGNVCDDGRIAVVLHRGDNGLGPGFGIAGLENARAHKHAVSTQLHHERSIGRGGNTSCNQQRNRQATLARGFNDEFIRGLELLGADVEFVRRVFVQGSDFADFAVERADVLSGLRNVAGTRLTLRADHGSALVDAAQGLAQVGRTADKRDLEGVLVDVVDVVGWAENFRFVHEVHAKRLQDLCFDLMADAGFGHDGNVNGLDDRVDEVRVGHAGNTALRADIGGHALQSHDRASSRICGYAGLFGRDNVHDDAALELVGQSSLDHARLCGGLMSGCCHGVPFGLRPSQLVQLARLRRPCDVTLPIVARKAVQSEVQFSLKQIDHLADGRLLSEHGPHPSPRDSACVCRPCGKRVASRADCRTAARPH